MTSVNDVAEVLGARPLGQAPQIENPTPIRLDNNVTKLQLSWKTVIKTGNSHDVYGYQFPLIVGKKVLSNKPKSRNRSEEYKLRSITRAITNIRRLALGNFKNNDKFVTLTFNDDNDFDITKLKECLVYLKKFLRRLSNMYPGFKYILVTEFQKRGAVHYHMICNLPFIDNDELGRIWGHGYTKILAMNNSRGVSVYLSKYLSKRLDDPRKLGHKLYYSSKNLIRPIKIYGEEAERLLKELEEDPTMNMDYSNEYETQNNGTATFQLYNPKQNDRT